MRKMNRLVALLAVLVMSTTMASTAFADGPATVEAPAATTGTITVQNAVNNTTYTLYKIFDATTDNKDNRAVSYTIPPTGVNYLGEEFNSLFETRSNGDKTYVIGLKPKKTNNDLVKWLNENGSKGVYLNEVTKAEGKAVTFTGLDYGYYYIHSDLPNTQGLAMAVTLKSLNVMAQEKNEQSGWGEKGGKTVNIDGTDRTFNIGDTIPYKVTYEKAYNFYVDKDKKAQKIYNYVLKDTMPAAVTLKENSFKVTVNGTEVKKKQDGVNDNGYSFSVDTEDNKKFTLTIPWAETDKAEEDDFYYHDAPARIVVTYNGVLNSNVVTGSENKDENINKASMYYNTKIEGGEEKAAPIYSGEIRITKVDGASKDGNTYTTKLAGATFVVKRGAEYLKYTDNAGTDDAFGTTTNIKDATKYVTNNDGEVVIRGLKQGTYKLVEIQAPDGYNVLNEDVEVNLAYGNGDGQDTLVVAPVVENFKGAQLPSTGGMGTTVFAIVGLLVMAGAAVTLIVKKRA
ncbi:MAG: SpaH/EbpB family LPXTG-anchored major pilin [Oribacterium sp.]|nr:SpaH/EbpB family LPXTG-anchored major pilin [Oribacterium sp.]